MHFVAMDFAPLNLIMLACKVMAISLTLPLGLVVIGQHYVRAP